MIIGIQNEILKIQSLGLLNRLLYDKTTNTNILWATDAYALLGSDYERDKEIQLPLIIGSNSGIIKNRARKAFEQQTERTRRHAEVFTPLWVCKKMNDYADEIWFGRSGVFFDEEGNPTENLVFPESKRKMPEWQRYIDSRRLEITCGEVPYLVSRYDVSTGEYIEIRNRIGILDRKLRVVNENARDESEWLTWAFRAFQSTYGYEFQGDNLLIARVNLLMTYEEYLYDRWKRKPTTKEYHEIIKTIVWNIWQMDGLRGTIPYCKAPEAFHQMNLFEWLDSEEYQEKANLQPHCRIYDWRRDNSLEYLKLNKGGRNMKFDFVIGNPPYQEDTERTSDKPVYHLFMDAAYKVSDKAEFITPARFLFNAGKTPKIWNRKMLDDSHLKVLYYAQDSGNVFPGTYINGGVVITYRDSQVDFGAIEVFSHFEKLQSIRSKIQPFLANGIITDIMLLQNRFNLDELYGDYPSCSELISSNGNERRIVTSAFQKLPVFTDVAESKDDIQIFGIDAKGKRQNRWINRKYVVDNGNLLYWKVLVSKSNGASGTLGEEAARIISTPTVCTPLVGYTQTFIGIGCFEAETEANACLKYIKSKFARALLGVLKITQDNPPDRWRYVPIQDFTVNSDIDWSQSIADIDRQLYMKYDLSPEEIDFIESHVKEMV